MKRICLVLAAALLGGCAVGARSVPPAVVYDFGLPAARLSAGGAWSALTLSVRSPAWFDSLNVDYRLAYEDPLKLREYVGSRWAGPPGVLLEQLLAQQLGTVGSGAGASCLLRVDVQEFSQVFAAPQQSRGVLQGSVRLFDSRQQLLAEREVRSEAPAASADAPGGVAALVAASGEFGRQVADWLDGLAKDKAVKRCRSTTVLAH